ncbi:hypothetical protein, partial [Micromonospora sp. b486]|uniref:hypothetical protein n=1 Tax=Micromonospora sp. b486 TaxID=3053986 RepID=UPI00259D242F
MPHVLVLVVRAPRQVVRVGGDVERLARRAQPAHLRAVELHPPALDPQAEQVDRLGGPVVEVASTVTRPSWSRVRNPYRAPRARWLPDPFAWSA